MGETEVGVPVPLDRAAAMFRDALPAGGGGTLQERREGYEAMLARLPIPADAAITADTLEMSTGTGSRPPARRADVWA